MKYGLLIAFVLIINSCASQHIDSKKDINVLFIGNSLTYFHSMPEIVQEMVNETNPNFRIEQIAYPGISLSGHLDYIIESQTSDGISTRTRKKGELTETEKKIQEKNWDIIILQEGTVSFLIPEAREYKVETAISRIMDIAKGPDCKFILFKTWPSLKSYPKQYCYSKYAIDQSLESDRYCSPEIESLRHEIDLINEAFDLVSEKYNLILADSGNKFYEVLTEDSHIDLYEDEIHPNINGSFLNACIFYHLLTGNKASDLNYNGRLAPKVAEQLKLISE